jgi:hypothetical protein
VIRIFCVIIGHTPSILELYCEQAFFPKENETFFIQGETFRRNEFWEPLKWNQISQACYTFWSEKLEGYDRFRVEILDADENISINTPENIQSVQLALVMAPLMISGNLQIPYDKICFTGIINRSDEELIAGNVEECQSKYDLLLKYTEFNAGKKENRLFVYVSNKNIETVSIKSLRIEPKTTVRSLVDMLSAKIVYPLEEFELFQMVCDAKIRHIIQESSTDAVIDFTYYFSNTDKATTLFAFAEFQAMIKENRNFRLKIFSPYPLLGRDIINATSDRDNPVWYEKMKQEAGYIATEEKNTELKEFRERLLHEMAVLKRRFFQHGTGKFKVEHIEDKSNEYFMRSDVECTENALCIVVTSSSGVDKHEYIAYKSNHAFHFCDITYTDDRESKELIEKLQRNFKEPPQFKRMVHGSLPLFIIYGPPGVGKSTITWLLASEEHRGVISSDDIINNHLFDDKRKYGNDEFRYYHRKYEKNRRRKRKKRRKFTKRSDVRHSRYRRPNCHTPIIRHG